MKYCPFCESDFGDHKDCKFFSSFTEGEISVSRAKELAKCMDPPAKRVQRERFEPERKPIDFLTPEEFIEYVTTLTPVEFIKIVCR